MDPKDLRKALVAPAAILAAGLVAATAVAGCYALKARAAGNVIEVTGSAERVVTSDVVKWTGRFQRNVAVDDLAVGNARIKEDMAAALAAAKDGGVSDDQVTVGALTFYPTYATDANGASYQSGYAFEQSFIVESGDVEGVTALAPKVADLMLSAGLAYSTVGLEYYYSKLADLKLDLISDATANAKERAARIAGSTGASLGAVRAAGLGVFQVTAVNSTEISDYGTYDTAAIEKKVTAISRASFQLK